MGSINGFLRGALLARQQAAQFEQLLAARQQRQTAQAQEGRAQELFGLQKRQAESSLALDPLRKQQLEQSVEMGGEQLEGLKLQNEKLKKMLSAFTDPKALDALRSEVEGLDLSPEEKAGFNIAIQESAQGLDLTPARTYIKDIILERGRNKRSANQQAALEARLQKSLEAADRRFFAGLGERQRQFDERKLSDEQAELAARKIAAGQASIRDFPQMSRTKILSVAEREKLLLVAPAVRKELTKIDKGMVTIETFEKTLTDFVNDPSPANAFRIHTQRKAFARPIGKGIFGEVGVFTDQDKEDFASIISPGGISIALFSDKPNKDVPLNEQTLGLAFRALQDLRTFVEEVKARELEGSFKTFKEPGAQRVIRVDSEGNIIPD